MRLYERNDHPGIFLLQELNIDPTDVENLLVSCILDK